MKYVVAWLVCETEKSEIIKRKNDYIENCLENIFLKIRMQRYCEWKILLKIFARNFKLRLMFYVQHENRNMFLV